MLSVMTKIILTLMTHANVAEGVVWIQTAWVQVGLWNLVPLFAFL